MGLRRREAKGGSRAAAEAAPQYFQVACPEGHRLRGLRTSTYQALRCPECGSGIFVLPRSPLPEPPRSSSRPPRPVPSASPQVNQPPPDDSIEYQEAPLQVDHEEPLEIVWDDVAAPAPLEPDAEIPEEYRTPKTASDSRPRPVPRPTPRTPRDRSPEAKSAPRRRPTPAPEPPPLARTPPTRRAEPRPAVTPPTAATRKIELPASPQPKRHRLGLVIFSAVLLAASTFAYRTWQSRLEKLPAEAEENWTQGVAALEAGDFDAAKHRLSRAAAAFERLGGRDERTPQARQLAREAAILADRINLSLEELVDEASRQDDPERWASRFETLYKGRSIIVDTSVEGPPPAGAAAGEFPLAFRILVGRGPRASRVGRIDLSGFNLFASQQLAAGDPVLFAARLAAVDIDGREWRVRLEPDSGVLLTRFDSLQLADWDPNHSARSTAEQPRLDPALPRVPVR